MKLLASARRKRLRQLAWAASCLAAAILAAGCGGSGTSTVVSSPAPPQPPPPPPSTPATAFTGVIRSGNAAVSGAAISFYAAGRSGPGAGSTDLLSGVSVASDENGKFAIPVFTCPSSSSQVYLVGRGGTSKPASGSDNPALVMMAALGDCGSINTSTTVVMNEVTAAASAWALAQFMAPGAIVGANSTNATGLRNAFLTVDNLVDNSKGTAPGPSLPQNTVLETAKLNSLADVLWACDQSAGGSACDSLFNAAAQEGATPSNTLDAALAIVRHAGANVSAVFAMPAGAPYQPALTAAPHDWLLSATFGNCTSGCGGLNVPGSLAIDSQGDVWVANYFGGAVSEFSPIGAPASGNGFSAPGIDSSFGIAVDSQDSVWVTNESGTAADGTALGSVTQLSSTGQNLSGNGYSEGGIYYPIAVAVSSGGDVWVADYAGSAATLLKSNGEAVSGSSGFAAAALPFTNAVAVDASQNGWFAFQGGVARVTPANGVTSFACCDDPAGIAIDAKGNVWVTDYGASSLIEFSPSGTIIGQATSTAGLKSPDGIAVDGNGNVWVANYRGETLTEFAGMPSQSISPETGFGLNAPLHEPFGVGVDASGNLWTSNAGSNTLTEFVGAAGPVKTPMLGTPVQP
jgi:streptogramin lyase